LHKNRQRGTAAAAGQKIWSQKSAKTFNRKNSNINLSEKARVHAVTHRAHGT
jgi:hypothetical protein